MGLVQDNPLKPGPAAAVVSTRLLKLIIGQPALIEVKAASLITTELSVALFFGTENIVDGYTLPSYLMWIVFML